MYHVYEHPAAAASERLAVLSDDELRRLTPEERAGYTLRRGGFRTALDAVVFMFDLLAGRARCPRPRAWVSA